MDPLSFQNVGREQGSETGVDAQHSQSGEKAHERKVPDRPKEKTYQENRGLGPHGVE